jgi:hypothetical protein
MLKKERGRVRWIFVFLGVFAPKIFGVVAKNVRFGIIAQKDMPQRH